MIGGLLKWLWILFQVMMLPLHLRCYKQVGPTEALKAYEIHKKRQTVKVWLPCIFFWWKVSTVSIKVMEDYSAISFVQCFIRLSFVVGYPKNLLPQERSQLIFGCESMRRNVQEKKITSISKSVLCKDNAQLQLVIYMERSSQKFARSND